MSELKNDKPDDKTISGSSLKTPRSRSLFFPVLLIAAGGIFLASNLGYIAEPNWTAALSLWPVLLILIGLNILVVQIRPPIGTLLSLATGLTAVVIFVSVSIAGTANPPLSRFGVTLPQTSVQAIPFSFPSSGLEAAEITVETANNPTDIQTLTGDEDLVAGIIYTTGDLELKSDIDNGQAEIKIGESNPSFFFNPFSMAPTSNQEAWQIGLSPDVPIDLDLETGNGSTVARLEDLVLTNLRLDSGNGSISAVLPEGDYKINIDSGNGGIRVSLAETGRQDLRLDSGNGSVFMTLPAGMEARVDFEEGNGQFSVDERFELISGDHEEGVYETAGYAAAQDKIEMYIETGNGSVRINLP